MKNEEPNNKIPVIGCHDQNAVFNTTFWSP